MRLYLSLPYLTALLMKDKVKAKGWNVSATMTTLASMWVNDRIDIDGEYEKTIKFTADRKRIQMAKNREKIRRYEKNNKQDGEEV